jgi:hypothetical protein
MKTNQRCLLILVTSCALFLTLFISFSKAQTKKGRPISTPGAADVSKPTSSKAVAFALSPAARDLQGPKLSRQSIATMMKRDTNRTLPFRNIDFAKTGSFVDATLNLSKPRPISRNAVTNPIESFDGPDADAGESLFGSRINPPDTNAAVGPDHVVVMTNMGIAIYDKTGSPLTSQFRFSQLLSGIPNAGDDDGNPIVLYDQLADRWVLSQFNLNVTNNSTHEHIAVSQTNDPTGPYFVYDFLLTANRPGDSPKLGVWPDGYYMATNDFTNPPFSNPFQGAGLYALERSKMLVGDPTAKIIAFNTNNQHGGMLPSNLQGLTVPPIGTPNLFFEFDADEFGAATDLIRSFAFHADFATPANSTLTQGPDIPTAAFDARANRIQQPAPGEELEPVSDRLMHALNFRVLPGGVQSLTLNFTVNVSGVDPTDATNYQGGVRWMELRRNAGTGVVTINQQATYAPGAGTPAGRDLWMGSVNQDGEGNIALAANAAAPGPSPAALNPTAIYTGRLAGDPANTLPQGEVDVLASVTRGVQIANSFHRWGDYSSLFIDPVDDCTFWGAYEYVDSPDAAFDWNTRIFSFKVDPACVTSPRGTFSGTITDCSTALPIEGAVIQTSDGLFRSTDSSGAYSVSAAPGTYAVTVTSAANFNSATSNVTVTDGGNTVFNVCLAPSAVIQPAGATIVSESCSPANGAIDPNELVTVSLCIQNTGASNTTNLVGTLQATGGVASPSGPQNYGVVLASGPAVCRNFTFTPSGVCGGSLTATLHLQDGATDLGDVTYTFTLGVKNVVLSENFDGVTAPALPAGWTTTFSNGDGDCTVGGPLCVLGSNWVTNTSTPDTAPNSVFHNDPSCATDNTLVSPSFVIATTGAQLTMRHNFNLEDTFDGSVLEVSINGGAFADIIAAGGSFVSGGYTDTISTNFLSSIAGRQAWSGNSGGYITTIANLGPNVAGQNIQLRFRFASDCSVGATGHRIDTISVSDGFSCCVPPPPSCALTCPANISTSNDPNQCGAVVNYAAPSSSGSCGTITCSPPSGSFFPVGTTTVTCSESGGASCTFTVTVLDSQPPTITCPANQVVVSANPGDPVVVNFPPPTAGDNCPGVNVVCTPASGSTFPAGVTTVSCTATDGSGNTASCSFTVTTFDAGLQDDAGGGVLVWSSTTGAYQICVPGGAVFTGMGTKSSSGGIFTLSHNAADRRLSASLNNNLKRGSAAFQFITGHVTYTITDRNTINNTFVCPP